LAVMVSGSFAPLTSSSGLPAAEEEISPHLSCAKVPCARQADIVAGPLLPPLPGIVARKPSPPPLPIGARLVPEPPSDCARQAAQKAALLDEAEEWRRQQQAEQQQEEKECRKKDGEQTEAAAGWALAGLRCAKLVRGEKAFEEAFELSEHELGRGLSGVVWEGLCRRTGRPVAVKAFKTRGMAPKALENLRREVELHSAVDHPGVVSVEAVYESGEEVHIVMEQLEGGEVFSRLVELGRFSEEETARVTVQLLQVLVHLHSKQVMHRDIKPENLIYETTASEHFRLIDFGFAARFDSGGGDLCKERCGTLQYVAPEIIRGCGYNEKVDLWSVGCLVYVLLTGKSLYRGNDQQVMKKVAAGEIDFGKRFKDLTEGAQDLILSLLEWDPVQRPSAAEALRHPWLCYLAPDLLLDSTTDFKEEESATPRTVSASLASTCCSDEGVADSPSDCAATAQVPSEDIARKQEPPLVPATLLQRASGNPKSELAVRTGPSVAVGGSKGPQDAAFRVLASCLADMWTMGLRDLAVICK